MDYKAVLQYLYEQLPMFQRIGKKAFKADLSNTLKLLEACQDPHHNQKYIHVAGTNGKGSTSHLIAATLQEAGYKVGLYTSPHLKDFRERIKINGEYISEKYVIDFVEKYRFDFERIKPSFFEITVVMALKYFSEEKTDVSVIETGLGGRLDSTNVIIPEISVITNISLDHTSILGDSLIEIAGEKAGIIKHKVPLVLGNIPNETEVLFENVAQEKESKIIPLEICPFPTSLLGEFQTENSNTAFTAIKELTKRGYNISDNNTAYAFNNVQKLTGFKGRWEILNTSPLTIADIGHNEAGIKAILRELNNIDFKNIHIIWGMVSDKDITSILSLLPKNGNYYFCKPNIPRGLNESELLEKGKEFGLKGQKFSSVKKAIEAAQKAANQNDLIFIGGSTFVVAEGI